MTFNIFLSHRHQDAHIAAALHEELEKWVGKDANIYRSSKPGEGRPGADLNEFLKSKLKETDLFILLFTTADEDWSYCMWELGVVTGRDTRSTQVVVFNCSDQQPAVRVAKLSVNARETGSILNFVQPFMQDPDWLILDENTRKGAEELIKRLEIRAEEGVEELGKSLMETLQPVLPKNKPAWKERLDYITLSLEPSLVQQVKEIRKAALDIEHEDGKDEDYENLREDAKKILKKNLKVRSSEHSGAARRFNLDGFEEDMVFKDLANLWRGWFKEHFDRKATVEDRAWIDALLRDISRATSGKRSEAGSELMAGSIHGGKNAVFQPVVVRTQSLADGGMEYVVYFFKVPAQKALEQNT